MVAQRHILIIGLCMLSACTSEWDMQGEDPKEYYAEHPVKNQVESRDMTYVMEFTVDKNRLLGSQIADLRGALRDIRPEAVERMTVRLSPSQMSNENRKQHITKLLRGLGYPTREMDFEASKDMAVHEAALDVKYAAVITPHCPDWRMSPVTTYSNTTQANFGCSTVTNLGLQVADPRDLEYGSGSNAPDADRNALVIRGYKSGQDLGAPSGGGAPAAVEAAGSAPAAQ